MILHDSEPVRDWLDAMAAALRPLVAADPGIGLVGIRRGGVDVARHLHAALGIELPLAELDVAFYRDDFDRVGLHPVVGPSDVPFDLDERHLVLVDDVLGTGRTVRAAMNELFDHGRPARITLAVLVERRGHELPIRADVVGREIDARDDEYVELDAATMTVRVGRRDELSAVTSP
mgnify:CR=1 FL=1